MHSGNIITAYGKPSVNFVFTNNLMAHNEYGIVGDNAGIGTVAIQRYFPNGVFRKNVIAGGRSNVYPPDNFFPASLAEARITDRAGRNYALSPASPYRNAATDGKAVGCDVGVLTTSLPVPYVLQDSRSN